MNVLNYLHMLYYKSGIQNIIINLFFMRDTHWHI